MIDTSPPSSMIINPISDSYYSTVDKINGTASDTTSGSGIKKVEISIKCMDDDKYWTGTDWSMNEHWLDTIGNNNWSFNSNSVEWDDGLKYNIRTRATDIAGNLELSTQGITIFIDNDKPVSTINVPFMNSFVNKLTEISGTASDINGSGISKVEISIKRSTDNHYWNGSTWLFGKITWTETSGAESWYYDSSNVKWITDNEYIINAIAYDNVGHEETSSAGTKFVYDDNPPEDLTILINDDNIYTNSSDVSLYLAANDLGSNVDQMSFSFDNKTWTKWEDFNDTRLMKLPDGDGDKKVYFRADDIVGNIALPVFDSITLDTTPPENLQILINDGASQTDSHDVTLSLSAVDGTSGVQEMALSNDGVEWTDWEDFNSNISYTLTSGDGSKEIYFIVKDKVGNIAEPVKATIILRTTDGPVDGNGKNGTGDSKGSQLDLNQILIIVVVIIIIIVVVLLLMRRKKPIEEKDEVITPDGMYVPQTTPQELPEPETIQEQVVAAPEVEPLQTQEQPQLLEQYQEKNSQQQNHIPLSEITNEQQTQIVTLNVNEQPAQNQMQKTQQLSQEQELMSNDHNVIPNKTIGYRVSDTNSAVKDDNIKNPIDSSKSD